MPRPRDLIPPPLRPPLRAVLHSAYRRRLAAEWWLRDRFETDRSLPPAKLRFRVGESCDPGVFTEVGRRTAGNIALCLQGSGFWLEQTGSVLDFGCGCGRTLRWLTEQFPNVQWYGSDVDAEAIFWCRDHLPGVYRVNSPLPPMPFYDDQFDLVFGVSVFTHLDEDYQRRWVPELHRVLKPGGFLLLSFYSEHVWEATADAADVARGGFVFRSSTKLKGIVPDWYQTAFQNRDRIAALLGGHFREVRFIDRGFGDHDAVLAVK